jgi:hypothetical protein
MNLIKARFLRDGEPQGRAYTYAANEELKVGDLVQLNEKGQGVVIEVNVHESEVESFKDKLKTIIGKVPSDNSRIDEVDEREGELIND